MLQFAIPEALGQQARPDVCQGFWKLGFQQLMANLAKCLFPAPAIQPLGAQVPINDAVLVVANHNGVAGQINNRGLVAQRFLNLFPFPDIDDERQRKDLFGCLNGVQTDLNRHLRAVAAKTYQFLAFCHGARTRVFKKPSQKRAVAFFKTCWNQGLHWFSNQIVAGKSKKLLRLVVNQGDSSGRIHHDDGTGTTFDNQLKAFLGLLSFGNVMNNLRVAD